MQPTATLPKLSKPLTKQKIENTIATANTVMQKFYLCIITLLVACLFYFILATLPSSVASSGCYYFLSLIHVFVSVFVFIFYNDKCNPYGFKYILQQYSTVDIEKYGELRALKNTHKAIAEYINKVGLDGREILNVELKLFRDYAEQCDKVESLLKNKQINEQIKKKLYTSESD